MKSMKRRISVVSIFALVAGVLALAATISPASAGTAVNTNACQNSATGTFTDVAITTDGVGAPNPATLGAGDVTLSGTNYAAFFDAAVLVAGYNLGLLTVGVNNIPGELTYTINASNTTQGSQTVGPIALVGQTTITDPDGTPGTGDETGTDLAVSVPVGDTIWTPSGGDIDFSDGGALITAQVAGGLISVAFTCSVGTSTPAGCVTDPNTDCTGFAAAAATPFDSVTVIAPPAPPVCGNGSASVGGGQSVVIDAVGLCTDQNSDIDVTSGAVVAPPAGGSVAIDAAGQATYTNTDAGIGTDSFTFTFSDLGGNGPSNVATVTISVLGNLCDATAGPCSLTQVVTFNVIGATLTMEQTGQFLALSDITLNGQPQVATGSLNDITILNARGDAAAWTVSAYSTDYGTPGAPTVDFDGPGPLPAVYDCSDDSGLLGGAGAADRLCITGNNMGWAPTAGVLHDVIPGDVAAVNPGPASAADAAAWLAELVSVGVVNDPTGGLGQGGLVGYTGGAGAPGSELCTAPINQSGGTFGCDADLFLGVPASAGAGAYNGAIILTLS